MKHGRAVLVKHALGIAGGAAGVAEHARFTLAALDPRIIADFGVEPVGSTPEQFGTHIREQMAKWGKVVREAGVKPE